MGITIHYSTERGNHLDPATAKAQVDEAIHVAADAARRYGWEFAGRSRRKNAWYLEPVPGASSVEGHGTIRSVLWNPSPGCESFALEWVEGTGILPYAFTKTQYAKDRVRVHAQICDLLEELNRSVFAGKLRISDEGGYLPGRSIDTLANSFGENEAVIRRLVDSARRSGWTVSSPLDDTDTHTPAA